MRAHVSSPKPFPDATIPGVSTCMSPGSRKQPEFGTDGGLALRSQENPSWHPGTLQRLPATYFVLVAKPLMRHRVASEVTSSPALFPIPTQGWCYYYDLPSTAGRLSAPGTQFICRAPCGSGSGSGRSCAGEEALVCQGRFYSAVLSGSVSLSLPLFSDQTGY
ncbi:hypothetical protein THAR02_07440 [Trichoderma harzianum]|uniref:Uncharacterized protein n=1 Tax=Trichoderma harzianum TaxID=5544 RepID=A0A0F9XJ30_TRIHA|nr:hypothetical protein THAR02_07440 [Trichoderma harzianum]